MMLGGIGLFQGIMAKMNWLDQNQRVISQNVANSDTPGYRAQTLKDVDFKSYLGASAGGAATGKGAAAEKLKMAATDEGVTSALNAKSYENPGSMKQKINYEASPDNNGVVLEEQLFKANENGMNYQLATNLYRRNVGMLRMVLGANNR